MPHLNKQCCLRRTLLQALQALSVAMSKVGELHHLQGDLPLAATMYEEALALRRQLLAAALLQLAEGEGGREGGAAHCSAALDLTASCIKLAGARHGIGGVAAEAEAEVRRDAAAL